MSSHVVHLRKVNIGFLEFHQTLNSAGFFFMLIVMGRPVRPTGEEGFSILIVIRVEGREEE